MHLFVLGVQVKNTSVVFSFGSRNKGGGAPLKKRLNGTERLLKDC